MNHDDLNECSAALLDRFPKWNPPQAVQHAYAELMRPYHKRVVLAAIAELWAESDKAWAEPTPAGLRKAISQAVHVGPPKSEDQVEYERRYYAMSRRDQLAEHVKADAALLEQGCFDTPADRDRCRERYMMERASLIRRDANAAARAKPWPPPSCTPDECGFAAMQIVGGRLCRQVRCVHLSAGEGS